MKKVLITGSSGFIGSAIFTSLRNNKKYDIYLSDFNDMHNFSKFLLPDETIKIINQMDLVIHMGAISETNASDPGAVFDLNIAKSIEIFNNIKPDAKIIYASSASVYGNANESIPEDSDKENPISLYAHSKLLLDNIVKKFLLHRNIIGLRFFNVCSFNEESRKKQPSPTYAFLKQMLVDKEIKLFHGSSNIYRDFIYINDVIDIINFFILNNQHMSGIYNVGTGNSVSFEEIADKIIKVFGYGNKKYIDRPENLTNGYQEFTKANIDKLKSVGYYKKIPTILEYIDRSIIPV